MVEDERVWAVKELLFSYVRSPSLRHIRDPYSVSKLAGEIVKRLDRGSSPWKKWDAQRELLLKSAIACWIPPEDLRTFLNQMDGPSLTSTDVTQRLVALEEEDHYSFAREEFRDSCLAIYEREKAGGTELTAIIGLLRAHVENEEERLRTEQRDRYERIKEQDRLAREQRLLSGADCGWTQLAKSICWYSRRNGRTYRLSPAKDKRWHLHRVTSVSDDEKGSLMGTYGGRADATKVIATAAYQPEPRW
ncbi:MAG: hypothetical protein J0I99_12650 [Devosia sp.]|uniref:hypothetical protein n=1 Tax=Devosia sp. TaxID=1871048 RepID=UPI001AC27935|nr:hypothetical protein [Devosia sp.]MBN9316584.1 hypothetical protein [Devosia sp.]